MGIFRSMPIWFAMTVLAAVAYAGETVSIRADASWTSTGIDVEAGDEIHIEARGRVRSGGTSNISPDGISHWASGNSARPSEAYVTLDAPCIALIGKIGRGEPFMVGSDLTFVAQESGRLYLGCNDDWFGDNSGSWSAEITLSSGSRSVRTSTEEVSIRADASWTSTGIDVDEGQDIYITASGRVRSGGTSNISPDGISHWASGNRARPSEAYVTLDAPCIALIGKIGTGEPFMVGSEHSFTADDSGRLYLGCNDDWFGDNSGSWSAEITY